MTDEAKRKRREYNRAYYRTHKEQRKKSVVKYWERKALADQGGAPDGAETIDPIPDREIITCEQDGNEDG